eukprot:GGOE01021345.1.p1 GENE.GGOE01021345.1~~GGOE01021345.1.p1  ORF type:complete len:299 (-),score=101.28 GGOE01021345.1:149-1045(-)
MSTSGDSSALVNRIADLRRQKEVAQREYEAALQRLNKAEQSDNDLGIRVHQRQQHLAKLQVRQEVDRLKQELEERRLQQETAEQERKNQLRRQEQQHKSAAREHRQLLEQRRLQEADEERRQRSAAREAERQEREQELQHVAAAVASRRAEREATKWAITRDLLQQQGASKAQRRKEVSDMVHEFTTRETQERDAGELIKQQRSKRRQRTNLLARAGRRMEVAEVTVQRILTEEAEADQLRREMHRLQGEGRHAAVRLLASEQRVLEMNCALAELAAGGRGNSRPRRTTNTTLSSCPL